MFHVYKNISGNNWGGRGVFSGATYAVVAGQYANVPIVGAHNAALSAWANLYINWDGTSGSNVYMKGNLGIGTTSPGKLLDVNGDINIAQGSAYYLASNKILWYNSTATTNIFAGVIAGASISTGTGMVCMGYKAGNAITASIGEVCIGSGAGSLITDTHGAQGARPDVVIGYQAGNGITTGYQNVVVGGVAGQTITTNTNNTCIGYGADIPSTYANCTFLGNNGGTNAISNNNEIQLGNSSIAKIWANVTTITQISDRRIKNIGIGT